MSAIPAWLSRRFEFDFPVDLYPNVLARYRGTPARLEEATQGLSHRQLTTQHFGKWSIQENVGHLLDEEALFTTRLREFLAGAESLTPAPYQHLELTHNQRDIDSILSGFRTARESQVAELATLTSTDFARRAWHPRLKIPMRLVDHVLFIAEHDDHHLARIWELRPLP